MKTITINNNLTVVIKSINLVHKHEREILDEERKLIKGFHITIYFSGGNFDIYYDSAEERDNTFNGIIAAIHNEGGTV